MKRRTTHWLTMIVGALALQGCVAIPPLIQVEHKDTNTDEIKRRLDEIDRRLDKIERAMRQQ